MSDATIDFSPVHGIGLFAKRHFEPGEVVFKPTGSVLHYRDYNWIFYFSPRTPNFGMHWLQISPLAYLDPKNWGKYINHSCDPNCGIRGRQTLVARRPIEI